MGADALLMWLILALVLPMPTTATDDLWYGEDAEQARTVW